MRRRALLFGSSVLVLGCGTVSRARVRLSAAPSVIARVRAISAAWIALGAERPTAVDRFRVPGDLALPGRLERDLGDATPQWLVVHAYESEQSSAEPIASALVLLPARRDPRFVHVVDLTPREEDGHEEPMVQGI